MDYPEESARHVVRAFETRALGTALTHLCLGLWGPTETLSELRDLVSETAAWLEDDNSPEEAAFCRALRARLDGVEGSIDTQAFLVMALEITGWAKPSPTKAAREFVAAAEGVAEVCQGLVEERRRRLLAGFETRLRAIGRRQARRSLAERLSGC